MSSDVKTTFFEKHRILLDVKNGYLQLRIGEYMQEVPIPQPGETQEEVMEQFYKMRIKDEAVLKKNIEGHASKTELKEAMAETNQKQAVHEFKESAQEYVNAMPDSETKETLRKFVFTEAWMDFIPEQGITSRSKEQTPRQSLAPQQQSATMPREVMVASDLTSTRSPPALQ